jgi:hypothetical protein
MTSLGASLVRLLKTKVGTGDPDAAGTASQVSFIIVVGVLGSVSMISRSTTLRLFAYTAVIFLTLMGVGLHRRGQRPAFVHVEVLAGLAATIAAAACTGGMRSIALAAMLLFPVYAGYALGLPSALMYGGIIVGLLLAMLGLDAAGVEFTNILPPQEEYLFGLATTFAVLFALIGATAALLHARSAPPEQAYKPAAPRSRPSAWKWRPDPGTGTNCRSSRRIYATNSTAPRSSSARRWHDAQQSLQQSRHMHGLALRAVAYLVAAAGAICHDDGFGTPADRRQQIGLGHLH